MNAVKILYILLFWIEIGYCQYTYDEDDYDYDYDYEDKSNMILKVVKCCPVNQVRFLLNNIFFLRPDSTLSIYKKYINEAYFKHFKNSFSFQSHLKLSYRFNQNKQSGV